MTCQLRWCGRNRNQMYRSPIWRTFGWIQWHVIPEPPATLQGAATWRIQCHDSRATCHTAGCCHLVNSLSQFHSHTPRCRVQSHCKKSMSWSCHIALQGVRIPSAIWKSFFTIFYFILFLLQFRLWRVAAFVSSPIHLFPLVTEVIFTHNTELLRYHIFG